MPNLDETLDPEVYETLQHIVDCVCAKEEVLSEEAANTSSTSDEATNEADEDEDADITEEDVTAADSEKQPLYEESHAHMLFYAESARAVDLGRAAQIFRILTALLRSESSLSLGRIIVSSMVFTDVAKLSAQSGAHAQSVQQLVDALTRHYRHVQGRGFWFGDDEAQQQQQQQQQQTTTATTTANNATTSSNTASAQPSATSATTTTSAARERSAHDEPSAVSAAQERIRNQTFFEIFTNVNSFKFKNRMRKHSNFSDCSLLFARILSQLADYTRRRRGSRRLVQVQNCGARVSWRIDADDHGTCEPNGESRVCQFCRQRLSNDARPTRHDLAPPHHRANAAVSSQLEVCDASKSGGKSENSFIRVSCRDFICESSPLKKRVFAVCNLLRS